MYYGWDKFIQPSNSSNCRFSSIYLSQTSPGDSTNVSRALKLHFHYRLLLLLRRGFLPVSLAVCLLSSVAEAKRLRMYIIYLYTYSILHTVTPVCVCHFFKVPFYRSFCFVAPPSPSISSSPRMISVVFHKLVTGRHHSLPAVWSLAFVYSARFDLMWPHIVIVCYYYVVRH